MKPLLFITVLSFLLSFHAVGQTAEGFKWVAEPQFDELGFFSDGLDHVKINKKWGYIDSTNTWVVQPQFKDAEEMGAGFASAELDGKWGYIDTAGAWVVQPQF